MRRAAYAGAGILLCAGLIFGSSGAVKAQEDAEQRTTRSSRTQKNEPVLEDAAKLDMILANQEEILQRLDAVMEELRVIKVRASRRGGS